MDTQQTQFDRRRLQVERAERRVRTEHAIEYAYAARERSDRLAELVREREQAVARRMAELAASRAGA